MKSNGFNLFQIRRFPDLLPCDYGPRPPDYFGVERIIMAKGSGTTPERKRFVESICALYPGAELRASLGTPHNRIVLGEADALARHRRGKRTLVFGEHRSAVRFSEESGNACPNYWHFSPYGFCFYGCKYCYLSGTPGVWHSPTIKIFVNLEEILAEIDRRAGRLIQPVSFYLGKLQDGLALDPLTAYSTVLVPFFAQHPFARQVILTKSAEVDRLLTLDHAGHTILSWSLNPPEIAARFEENTPSVEERIQAMQKCAAKGYPVRAVMMPIIPVPDWEKIYSDFIPQLLGSAPLQRLTLGGICIYQNARTLMDRRLGQWNEISGHIDRADKLGDGRARYAQALRIEMYSCLVRLLRELRPNLEVALCLEEKPVWEAVGLADRIGRCNCSL